MKKICLQKNIYTPQLLLTVAILHSVALSVAWAETEKKTSDKLHKENSTESSPEPVIIELDEVSIDRPPTAQEEAANNYTVGRSSSATKLNLELHRTPQTVSVITEKQIRDQKLTDINTVLQATPGISTDQSGVTGVGHVFYYSRGFRLRNFMLDGVLTSVSPQGGMFTGQGLNSAERFFATDSAIYERVDVIRGSTGLVSGNGGAGGTLNLVRKRPTEETLRRFSFSYGRWDSKRAELDVSTTLHEKSDLRWRMVGVVQDAKHWMRYVSKKDYTIYNILELPLGERTILRGGFSYSYQRLKGASPVTAGSWAVGNATRYHERSGGRNRNSATRWSFAENKNLNAFLNLDHSLNDNWTLNVAYNYNKINSQTVYGFLGMYSKFESDPVGKFAYNIGQWLPEVRVHGLDLALHGKFELFGKTAEIIAGVSGYNSKAEVPQIGDSGMDGGAITHCGKPDAFGEKSSRFCTEKEFNDGWILRPISSIEGRMGEDYLNIKFWKNNNTEKQYGVHLMGLFNPTERFMLVLGGRYNWWVSDQIFLRNTGIVKPNNKQDDWARIEYYSLKLSQAGLSWFGGLVYDVNDQWSAYASYARTIDPQSEAGAIVDQYGKPIKEQQNNTLELGVKTGLLAGRLNTQISIFQINQHNLPYAKWAGKYVKPVVQTKPGSFYEPVFPGQGLKVKGIELAVSGILTPYLQINAGYTFQNFTVPDFSLDGLVPASLIYSNASQGQPKHQFKLFSNWQTTSKLNLGLGMNFKDKITYYLDKSTRQKYPNARVLKVGSWITFDIIAGYQINKNWHTQLNLNNLFDREYYTGIRRDMYGAPRNLTLTLQGSF